MRKRKYVVQILQNIFVKFYIVKMCIWSGCSICISAYLVDVMDNK